MTAGDPASSASRAQPTRRRPLHPRRLRLDGALLQAQSAQRASEVRPATATDEMTPATPTQIHAHAGFVLYISAKCLK